MLKRRTRAARVAPLLLAVACGDDGGPAQTGTESGTTTAASTETGSATTTSGATESTTTNDVSTTSATATTTSTSSPTSDATSGDPTGDTESDTMTTDPPSTGVTIDNATSPSSLIAVDLASGSGQEVCDMPPNATYDSITFVRDGTFLVHNVELDRIEDVDPCDCGFQVVGPTSIGSLEMTADDGNGLFGVDLDFDAFLTVNRSTGLASVVGSLGIVLDEGAIAWSDAAQAPYILDATADQLLTIDTGTGAAGQPVALSSGVATPGMDYDNATDTLYACSGDDLLTISPSNGVVTVVGSLGLAGACDNLAVPFGAIACLE